ncbi:response regulator [Oceanobacter mangrovi]|uniref:response regulator n=1 Tax=Oceanobacter mangrovi TaxID=2862510 RepID=UPI001C8F0E3F|nr:response regulator [Oceanobacter mangrovi]
MSDSQTDLQSRLFWGLWHNSPDNMFILRVQPDDYYVMGTNQSLADTVEQSIPDMNGKPLRSILTPEFRDFVVPNYDRCVKLNKPIQYEEEDTFSCPGITRYWSTMLSPIGGADGKVAYIFGISRNVTELKRAQRQAQQAAMEADKANRVKTAFLANMSHELRTPLNGIRSAAELLIDNPSAEERNELCRLIGSATEAMTRLTSDVLDYARLDSGVLRMESKQFSVQNLFADVQQILQIQARDKGLDLRCELDKTLPPLLRGDPGRIKQVLLNLASNAVKFTDVGTVRLSLQAGPREGSVQTLLGEVADSGIGIRRADQARLFQAFSQLDDSTTRPYQGTGLGLAISKDLVENMGGHIHVESEFGKGSCFRFQVRCEVPEQQPSFLVRSPEVRPDQRSLKGLKVLLVEDNYINQKVSTRLLEREGMRVTPAINGQVALQLCQQQCFDLVLMDWHMPAMDGLQATREIRQLSLRWQQIPIIALTANAMESDRRICLDAGMDDVITKPMDSAELFQVIRRLVFKVGNGR